MKKYLNMFWRLLRSNLVLKIMALLFAVILWSYVLSEENPTRVSGVNDVAIQYENEEDLTDKGLAISGSLSEILEDVDLRIEVKQSELKYLTNQNVDVYVDLSGIDGTGYYTLDIEADTTYGDVLDINPSEVTLYVDDYVTRTVPVDVEVIGEVPDGYYASEPEITPDVLSISGAKVDVETVSSAVCSIDLTGLTEGYKKSVSVTLLDTEGNPVDENLFSDSFSVIVEQEVLSEKIVPVDVANSILGQDDLATGYEITEITCDPESVQIVGEAATLDEIDSVLLVAYSVSGASEDAVIPLDYDLPEGVQVLDTDKAQVYINIREITGTSDYSDVEIEQKNLSSGLTAVIDEDTVDVTVIAGLSKLSKLSKSDIVPYVDLDGLEPGVYSLDVLFEIPEGFVEENFSASTSTVTVTITEK